MNPITPIQIRGRYFWRGDERFLLNGVVYQLSPKRRAGHSPIVDSLEEAHLDDLRSSLPLLKQLGINVLFVYSIDPTKSHDISMNLLADAGIYVLPCLSTPRHCINRNAPFESYNENLLQHYFRTIDCIASYPNILGVIVANEVLNSHVSTTAAPVIRAVTRDVKRYMSLVAEVNNQRVLPVGVSSSKIMNIFVSEFKYMTGGKQNEAVDFFCWNDYAWCGESSLQISGYDRTLQRFEQTHVPVFMSEYGTNVIRPRLFRETCAIFSPQMTDILSGGIVYEFFEGVNQYGLVKRCQDGSLEPMADFRNLEESLISCRDVRPITLPDWSSSHFTSAKAPDLPLVDSTWKAGHDIPESPLNWNEIREQVEDSDWVDVEREIQDLTVDELARSMWGRFRIDGTGPQWN